MHRSAPAALLLAPLLLLATERPGSPASDAGTPHAPEASSSHAPAALETGNTEAPFHLPAAPRRTTLFRNVHVLPMDADRVLERHDVLVEDARILEVAPTGSLEGPAGALVVEGEGRYLMPGLADMHTHLRQMEELPLYLANGVTTVASLGQPEDAGPLEALDEVNDGRFPAPRILPAYFMDGPGGHRGVVDDPEEARRRVRQARAEGYAFIKVYNRLSTPVFDAIADEAGKVGLPVIGHGVRDPGLAHGFDAGQVMVVHAEEYLYTLFRNRRLLDPGAIPPVVDITRTHGAFVTPTLSAYERISRQWGQPEVVADFLALPEVRFLTEERQDQWRATDYAIRDGTLGARILFLRRLTRALARGGVPLLLGTDSPGIPGMFPGFSIHDEVRSLEAAGLTPFEILQAGTRNAGAFVSGHVPGADAFGTVEAGKRADLLLLESNPLEDLEALRTPAGVMIGGRWYARAALQRILDRVAEENQDR